MKNRDIDYVDVSEKKECQYKDVPKKNESQYKDVSSKESGVGGGTYYKAAEPTDHIEMRKIARGTGQSTGHSGKAVRRSKKKRAPSAGKILLCVILLVVTGVSYVWMYRRAMGEDSHYWDLLVYMISGWFLLLITNTEEKSFWLWVEIAAMALLGTRLGAAAAWQLLQLGNPTTWEVIGVAGAEFLMSFAPLILFAGTGGSDI